MVFYIHERHILTPYFMYKMHVIDIFAAFYIREKIILANFAKIKCSQIKILNRKSEIFEHVPITPSVILCSQIILLSDFLLCSISAMHFILY